MKREKLTEVLRCAAADAGYAFHTGPLHLMSAGVRVYPAAWLEPPVLKSAKGRAEGVAVYRVTMHMMSLPAASGKEQLRSGLEDDAVAAAKAIAANEAVCGVSDISCTTAERSLSTHGEVSVTLTCDVSMWFIG